MLFCRGLERVQKQIDASKVDDLQAQFMSTCAERDTLVERVQKLEATLASMGDVRKMQKDLTEKTQQIEELMAEGIYRIPLNCRASVNAPVS